MHSIPIDDLADALGTCPDALAVALDLAEHVGAVKIVAGVVEMPPHLVARLGLIQDREGRWREGNGRDVMADRPQPDRRRGRKAGRKVRAGVRSLPSDDFSPDRRTLEPWQELSRTEEPPPDRVASVVAWMQRWSATPAPPRPPGGDETKTVEARSALPAEKARQQRNKLPGQPPTPSSFSLVVLRAKLDAAKTA